MRFVRGHATRKHDFGYDEDENGCWIFRGYVNPVNGYGYIGQKAAHRIYYEKHRGPIPSSRELDHLCRVHHCVNPEHLEAVTHSENARRGDTGKHPKLKARRLSTTDVREIRRSVASNRVLARNFEVSRETIRMIRKGEHYKEVE